MLRLCTTRPPLAALCLASAMMTAPATALALDDPSPAVSRDEPVPAPTPLNPSSAPATSRDKTAASPCAARSAQEAVSAIAALTSGSEEHARVASRLQHLPNSGTVDLLLFRQFNAKDDLSYRIIILDAAAVNKLLGPNADMPDKSGTPQVLPKFEQILPFGRASAEEATSGPGGTDFLWKEAPSVSKTLLRFNIDLDIFTVFGEPARLYVIGCKADDPDKPSLVSWLDIRLSSPIVSAGCAIVLCILFYVGAAIATFRIRKSARKDNAALPNRATNYATIWRHFDPVVLTAGPTGRGSAAKLQILFFSLLVLGMVFYIWMLTGQLTGLSTTVLLLMGISGIGATAAAGTDVAKNRLDFDNWAWLISRGWLPKGGSAELNFARWKDIFATDGEFDATRFQMVTFSVMVGLALLAAGVQLTDLSTFDIPVGLLGILGLSQAVYVAGKLVAPPAISEFNKKLDQLRQAEATLRDKLGQSNPVVVLDTMALISDDEKAKDIQVAYGSYAELWGAARIMFYSTLGSSADDRAATSSPLLPTPQSMNNMPAILPDGRVNSPYVASLIAVGGKTPYRWGMSAGSLPLGISATAPGVLSGTPTTPGKSNFELKVTDAEEQTVSVEFTISVS
ncbi:putative Ig domain-containing protein (plasmid) [Cupriavidus pinatubonensis]|uniref:Ig domain-containing protein n=1 Tax=Cupriavidus pinatubonensis TaxID=248026 RepID=UPI001C7393C3|nr:Ig domain-containing protein [Cupriavidus pinatubonensis]QYY33785.1 putative Ig domain-containing protein [Cupriavidus pinatubonensis]